jgi:hypothetical protein
MWSMGLYGGRWPIDDPLLGETTGQPASNRLKPRERRRYQWQVIDVLFATSGQLLTVY